MSPRANCVLSTAMQGEYTQSALAEALGIDKTTMVVTVDALERAGLVERRTSSADRRARVIAVTDGGRGQGRRGRADRGADPGGRPLRALARQSLCVHGRAAPARRRAPVRADAVREAGAPSRPAQRRRRLVPYEIILNGTIWYGPGHVRRDLPNARDRRPLPLDRTRRALRRFPHDHPRRHDRERGAPVDPGRPRLLPVEPRLGRERLSDRVRRPAAARRTARRPDRPPAHLPHRPGGVHHRIAAVRARLESGGADRRPLPAGPRRRADLRRHPRHDRDDVPGAARAGEGDRDLQLRRLGRRVDRPAGRRRAHAGDQLALDLLRQRPDRDRDRGVRPAAARPRRGHRPAPGRGRARRGAGDRGADARRLHDRGGGRLRLDLPPHARARRGRPWRSSAASSRARRPGATRCSRCACSARATWRART